MIWALGIQYMLRNDVLSKQTTIRRRKLQRNAANTDIAQHVREHMDYRDS